MANTFNENARSQQQQVEIYHNEIANFILFLRGVQADIGTDYKFALQIPARATRLINAKSTFDALSLDSVLVKRLLEKDKGYIDWTPTHTSDVNSIVSKATTLRTLVENNVDRFPASYSASHQLQYVTANAATQTALNNQINSILTHVV